MHLVDVGQVNCAVRVNCVGIIDLHLFFVRNASDSNFDRIAGAKSRLREGAADHGQQEKETKQGKAHQYSSGSGGRFRAAPAVTLSRPEPPRAPTLASSL